MDLLDLGDNRAAGSIVETVMRKDSGSNQMVLPGKYLNFSNMFVKAQADVLPQHSHHNLVIELETNKQSSFDTIYDLSRSELDMLCEYINEMLAKGFITFSKSLLGAPVLFTNKKNKDLRLCVDYRSLNAITKKNKYLLPLVKTLLICFAGAKYYIKVDIIAAYNILSIWASNKQKTVFKYCYRHFEY